MVLARLSTEGMQFNASKSGEKIEYLGYRITRKGIQPVYNKVEVILKMKATKPGKNYSNLLA
jgi:hypothetical protein